MDSTLANIHSAHTFLDEIIIITKETITEHEEEIDKVLHQLNAENRAINLKNANLGRQKPHSWDMI